MWSGSIVIVDIRGIDYYIPKRVLPFFKTRKLDVLKLTDENTKTEMSILETEAGNERGGPVEAVKLTLQILDVFVTIEVKPKFAKPKQNTKINIK